MLQTNSPTNPFDAYLGQIVFHEDRLHLVSEVRIQREAVYFIIRNGDGDETKITTTVLLDGLVEL